MQYPNSNFMNYHQPKDHIYQTDDIPPYMNQQIFNNSQPPVQNSQKIQFTPTCLDIIFMLPFPFFCVGCCACLSMTAQLNFDNNSRNLFVKSYPGYCCCLAKSRTIPYSSIRGSSCINMPNLQINQNPAFQLMLETNNGDVQLTGGKVRSQVEQLKIKLDGCLSRSHFRSHN